MHRKKCLYLLSLSLTLAVAFGLSSPGWAAAPAAAGDRLTVSGTFKNPSNKGVKEVEVEVLVDGKHVKPEGKDEDIVTGKQGTFMREFVLPAGTLPAAKVEVAAKKPNWEPLKPTAVSLVDAGADAQGNRVFQAASTFPLKRAVTPAFWLATLILLGVYVIISFEWMHRTLAALLGAALILFISYTAGVLDKGYFILSFEDAMGAIDLNVIFLLIGMKIFVGVLKKTAVFQFLAYKSYAWAKGNVFVLSFALQFLTGPTSARVFPQVIELIGRGMAEFGLIGPGGNPERKPAKLVLITNGSLADRPRVQDGLEKMAALNGEVWFKFDSATSAGMRAINQTRISPDKQFECLGTTARLCPTWMQTCAFALDGMPPSAAEQDAYLAAVARIRQQQIPVQGVLLYGLARPSMQPQASRLSALPAVWLDAFAEKIRVAGPSPPPAGQWAPK